MEFFIPSILLLIFAMVIIIMVIPKVPHMVLIVFVVIALLFTIENHYSMFTNEYKLSTWLESIKQFAPNIMITVIVLFLIGYILYLFGQKKGPTLNAPPANIPPPSTATNMFTEAIGHGMLAAGLTNVDKNAGGHHNNTNASKRNVAGSILSAGI